MKLNKKSQIAIMAFLFIFRHKRATGEQIAESLKLQKDFVNQILRQLRIAELIRSVKGPGGGHEIANESASLWQVIKATGSSMTNTEAEVRESFQRGLEGRVLAVMINKASTIMGVMLNQPLIDIYKNTVPAEIRSTLDVE